MKKQSSAPQIYIYTLESNIDLVFYERLFHKIMNFHYFSFIKLNLLYSWAIFYETLGQNLSSSFVNFTGKINFIIECQTHNPFLSRTSF